MSVADRAGSIVCDLGAILSQVGCGATRVLALPPPFARRDCAMALRTFHLVVALATAAAAHASDRLPTIPPVQYSEEQKKAAADFEAARKAPPFGPFVPLMHSPQVMTQARAMGDYLRYQS